MRSIARRPSSSSRPGLHVARLGLTALHMAVLLMAVLPLAEAGDEMQGPGGAMAMPVEVPRGYGDLTRATIVASPGVPGALGDHLPSASLVSPLPWPLPRGPLLLLGLPESDPHAAAIGQALGLIEEVRDLQGGYGIWAWEDGDGATRCIVLAADPAALFAARFELVADAPRELLDPAMRGVDTRGAGDGRAATLVVLGARRVTPRFAGRGLVTGDAPDRAAVVRLAGQHVNRLWLEPEHLRGRSATRLRRQLRRFGIAPVAQLHVPPAGTPEASVAPALDTLRSLQASGIEHFALHLPPHHPRGRDTILPPRWTVAAVEAIKQALMASPPHSLVIVPHGGQLPMRPEERAAIGQIPYARLGVSVAEGHAEDLRNAQLIATWFDEVPVCLMERWAAPFQDVASYRPSAPPRQLDDVLGRADEVVVLGARGTGRQLARLWTPEGAETRQRSDPRSRARLPLLAPDDDPWVVVPAALDAISRERHGAAWARARAEAIHTALRTIEAGGRETIPHVAARPHADGALGDPAWAHARFVPFDSTRDVDLANPDRPIGALVLHDGQSVHVGLRLPMDGTLVVKVTSGRDVLAEARLPVQRETGELRTTRDGRRLPVAIRGAPRARTAELELRRLALESGAAHPGTLLHLTITHERPGPNPARLSWPATDEGPAAGALLLLP